MEATVIRKARLAELSTLLEFEQAIVEYERPFVEDMKTEKFNYYDLKELIESENAEVLVVEVDTKLVASGYVSIKKSLSYLRDEYHAFLGFMYVDPNFRGKGINKQLIDELIVWSKNKGMKMVSLTVFDDNKSAIKAYDKSGFKKHLVEMRKEI